MTNNPLNILNWRIKKFLIIIFSIQISVISLIGLDLIFSLNFIIIREIITLSYILVVPGILIVRILKLDKISNYELILYSIGISIATILFIGIVINQLYPFLGILNPISIVPLLITFSGIIIILSLVCYLNEKNNNIKINNDFEINDYYLPALIFLIFLPLLSILGTYLVNYYLNNIILMFLIIIVVVIPILVAFDKFIPKKMFPLAIFAISLSLIYHTSLISQYIWGIDIHGEYYFSNLVLQSGIWNLTDISAYNAVASINILAPILSIFSSLSLDWIFKIIYPFLLSLTPLGLYYLFKEQTNDKIAFLSCYLFVALFVFYNDLIALARQEIAELFLILLLMVIMTKNIKRINKSILMVLFGSALIISHYGLSYIYMMIFVGAFILEFLIKKINKNPKFLNLNFNPGKTTISITFVILFIIITLSWYMYVANAYSFNIAVKVLNNILSNVTSEFLNPETVQGIELITRDSSFIRNLSKYLHILIQIFIGIGLIKSFFSRKLNMRSEYKIFSLLNFFMLIAAITMPYFAESFNTSRLYHISLILLAPFFVIGALSVLKGLQDLINIKNIKIKNCYGFIALILSVFLLFNTGFIYEITNDSPSSIALSQYSIKYENIDVKASFYSVLNNFEHDIFSVKWLNRYNDDRVIYTDYISLHPLISRGKLLPASYKTLPVNSDNPEPHSLIFLGHANVMNGIIVEPTKGEYPVTKKIDNSLLNRSSLIYTNGAGEIYLTPI